MIVDCRVRHLNSAASRVLLSFKIKEGHNDLQLVFRDLLRFQRLENLTLDATSSHANPCNCFESKAARKAPRQSFPDPVRSIHLVEVVKRRGSSLPRPGQVDGVVDRPGDSNQILGWHQRDENYMRKQYYWYL